MIQSVFQTRSNRRDATDAERRSLRASWDIAVQKFRLLSWLRSTRLGGFMGVSGQKLCIWQAFFWQRSAEAERRSSRLSSPQIPSPAGHCS